MRKEAKPSAMPWRWWLGGAVCCAVLVSSAFAAHKVRSFALTDTRFALVTPEFRGLELAPRGRLMQTFAPDMGRSVFRLPLAERRRRLLAIDWVEEASISRIWPNQIIVRIQERKPVAFVKLPGVQRSGLIDAHGVLLSPARKRFAFPILTGVSEEQSDEDRRDRLEAMQGLLTSLGAQAAKDISEVDASSVADLRVTTSAQGRAVELWMGNRNYSSRYRHFMDHYAEIRQHSPHATRFDLRIDDQIIER